MSPRIRLIAVPVVLAVACAVVPAAGAQAATIAANAVCYTEGSTIGLTGAGFTPGATVTVAGQGISLSGPTDPAGAFSAFVTAPALSIITPGERTVGITAIDPATQVRASIGVRVAKMTFDTPGGVKAPGARREWRFSGFLQQPGKPIYGHFRHRGRTYANYRFGVPTGPCGMLKVRAPGIPVKRVSTGKWTVQIDFSPAYHPATRPAVRSSVTVFTALG